MSELQEAIKKRLREIEDFLQFDPTETDAELAEIMTLGDEWDVPEVVIQALDSHPQYEARYIGLRRTLEIARNRAKDKLAYFEAKTKEWLDETIFDENVTAGMTANNAKPTGPKVNHRFLIDIVEGDPKDKRAANPQDADDPTTIGDCVKLYRELNGELELAEGAYLQVKIITDALKSRKDLLISMSSLLGRLVDNKLIILRSGARKARHEDEDGFK